MNKEQLLEVVKEDMKHWSVGALKYALAFIDDKCLCVDGDNDADVARWWWELRKAVREVLDKRESES